MAKVEAAGPLKIWLTRHGESQFNVANKLGGNSRLTVNGNSYAQKLGEVFYNAFPQGQENVQQHVQVWTSTLTRTIETASKLPAAFQQHRFAALDEINAGICENLTYDEMKDQYPDLFSQRKADKLRFRYPGPSGESYEDLIARVDPVVEKIKKQQGYLIIVAHQAVGRVIYARLVGRPVHEIPNLEMPLHTLFEFTPQPDGSFQEHRTAVNVPQFRRQLTFEDKCTEAAKLGMAARVPEVVAQATV